MKKLLLATCLVLGLMATGCGKKEAVATSETKVYKVGTNAEYPPFEYLENGKVVGFDIDVIEAVSKKVGFKYEVVDMSFDGLIPALQSEKIDILIAAMTTTPERAKAVNFTIPYNESAITFLTNSKNAIKNMDDLNGKKYGVQLGTTQEGVANEIPEAKVTAYNAPAMAILDLKSEKLDGVIVDKVVAQNFIDANPDLVVVGSLPADQKAIAVNKTFSAEMLTKINSAIEELKKDGTIAELEKKYKLVD